MVQGNTGNYGTPFGWKVFLFGVGFRQVLPIFSPSNPTAPFNYCVSELWQHV